METFVLFMFKVQLGLGIPIGCKQAELYKWFTLL